MVSSAQFVPVAETNTRPLAPVATRLPFRYATALKDGPPLMDRLVQVLPSGEVTMAPLSPTATKSAPVQATLVRLAGAAPMYAVHAVPLLEA